MQGATQASAGTLHYLREIRRFPLLEAEEESVLARRWREDGDGDAAHKLATSHLRLVAKIATGYRGYGLPISELISEGNFGLMQAAKRFDPAKGVRFATYAVWWIKAAIQEYILRSWSLVRIGTTTNQRKLFFNLRKAKQRISALEDGALRPDQVGQIARRLDVTEQDVIEMNRRLAGDVSLNAPIGKESDSGEWQDWLVDETSDQESRLAESEETANRRKHLGEALTLLHGRERRIFEARRIADEPITLEELADEFNISRERVRQIEARAFQKVQRAVQIATAHTQPHAAGAVVRIYRTYFCVGRRVFAIAADGQHFLHHRRHSNAGHERLGLASCLAHPGTPVADHFHHGVSRRKDPGAGDGWRSGLRPRQAIRRNHVDRAARGRTRDARRRSRPLTFPRKPMCGDASDSDNAPLNQGMCSANQYDVKPTIRTMERPSPGA
jgi:RNA polymerase sigma-32 factor